MAPRPRTILEWLTTRLPGFVQERLDGVRIPLAADYREQVRLVHAALAATPQPRRWRLPFPMAVFGTLRTGFDNHRLMHGGRVWAQRRAFLPHFQACAIELEYRHGASAPFEVYFYEPRAWRRMIGRVDRLEDFYPGRSSDMGYQRTLAWLHLLPDDFAHPAFALDQLGGERDLHLDPRCWQEHERVPCWIYSSVAQNQRAAQDSDSPLIWDGVVYR